jgi:hypothetical protein
MTTRRRFICSACGKREPDIRPDFHGDKPSALIDLRKFGASSQRQLNLTPRTVASGSRGNG